MRRLLTVPLTVVCALGLTAQPLAAQSNADVADAKCVAVLSQIVATNPELTQEGTLLIIYFVGKLKGRDPNRGVEALLTEDLIRSISPAEAQSLSQSCTQEAIAVGQELQRFGGELPSDFPFSVRPE